MESLLEYIQKNGTVSSNMIAMFVAQNPDCVGELEKLIRDKKVKEIEKNLYQAV